VAIGDREHACLLTVEAFLNYDLVAGIAKLFMDADALDGLQGLVAVLANYHTFAGGEAVGFDHHGRIIAIFEVGDGGACIAEDAVLGGGDIGVAEQILAKHFARFELGGRLRRAERAEARLLESVDESGAKRGFGAHDREADLVATCEVEQAFNVGRGDINIFGIGRGAGVTGRDEHAIDTAAKAELPGQGVFASTVSNNKNLHESIFNFAFR
jgi:hypothetical protein